MSNYTKQQVEEAKKELLEILHEGDDVYFIIHSVAKSGMSRTMSLHIPRIGVDGKLFIQDITWLVARVLDYKLTNNYSYSFRVNGCGMDMTFAVVYDLAITLFGREGCNFLHNRMIS
jgi:hypothetical protein